MSVQDLGTNTTKVSDTKGTAKVSKADAATTSHSHLAQSHRPLWKTMLVFLIPLMISNALQSLGQLESSILLGRWIGVEALAAVSAFFPIFFLLLSFVIGIGSGSSILIGQAYGANNEERMKAIVGTSLTFAFAFGLVLAVVGGIFTWDVTAGGHTREHPCDFCPFRQGDVFQHAAALLVLRLHYTDAGNR